MLNAVSPPADGFENLAGYIANAATPTAVPGFDVSKRQPLQRPTNAVPGPNGKLPTSSGRPGKQTNQRVLFTRVQTGFGKACDRIDRVPVQEGDIVFVHRYDGMATQGHDFARTSRVATLTQLNQVLANPAVQPDDIGYLVMDASKSVDGETPPPEEPDRQKFKWQNCKILAEWVPDGVLATREHDCVMHNSNPGEAYGIAIAGPTLVRNAAVGDFPQHIDDGASPLDKLFVGLFSYERRDASGNLDHYYFQFKALTSRQLVWAWIRRNNPGRVSHVNASAAGGNNRIGPTMDEFDKMQQVWRIGTVMDSRSGMHPYRCLTLNVVVEEWDKSRLKEEIMTS